MGRQREGALDPRMPQDLAFAFGTVPFRDVKAPANNLLVAPVLRNDVTTELALGSEPCRDC
jgi:hypothetical protein